MDIEKLNTQKQKLLDDLLKAGISEKEVTDYMEKEYKASCDMAFDEARSRVRAFVSTVNYYKKYIDKLGSRAKFICLGITAPTDYGMKKKVADISKRWYTCESDEEKDAMIEKKIISENGRPLHTQETTLFEEKWGKPIILDEELTQSMIGIVELPGTGLFPCIVRVNGKVACDEKKILYQWSFISGEQGSGKQHPNWVYLNSRELLMKSLPNEQRLKMDAYKALVEKFTKNTINLNDDEQVKKLEEFGGDFVFLKNGKILNYNFFGGGTTTSVVTEKGAFDVNAPIIAEARISKDVDLDVDPNCIDELWLCTLIRKKKPQDTRLKVDILGMFVENPVDKSMFAMEEDFLTEKPLPASNDGGSDDFFKIVEKAGGNAKN